MDGFGGRGHISPCLQDPTGWVSGSASGCQPEGAPLRGCGGGRCFLHTSVPVWDSGSCTSQSKMLTPTWPVPTKALAFRGASSPSVDGSGHSQAGSEKGSTKRGLRPPDGPQRPQRADGIGRPAQSPAPPSPRAAPRSPDGPADVQGHVSSRPKSCCQTVSPGEAVTRPFSRVCGDSARRRLTEMLWGRGWAGGR